MDGAITLDLPCLNGEKDLRRGMRTMDEILETLSQHAGVSPETAKSGLGAILTFIKDHLPSELFEKIERSLPGLGGAVDSYQEAQGSGVGLMGAITGLAGKFLGGGGADVSRLLSMLSTAGLSVAQMKSFLPKAVELLKDHLPTDLVRRIEAILAGALGEAAPEKA
jgi:hypothetical protein